MLRQALERAAMGEPWDKSAVCHECPESCQRSSQQHVRHRETCSPCVQWPHMRGTRQSADWKHSHSTRDSTPVEAPVYRGHTLVSRLQICT
jgi:hypothetical protein